MNRTVNGARMSWTRRAVTAMACALGMSTLSGCGDVLDVDLPAELTDEALNDPAGASTKLNAIIVGFEAAFGEFFYALHGREDGGEIGGSSTGLANPYVYTP